MERSFVRRLIVVVVGAALILCVKSADATTYFRFVVNGDTSATTMVQGDILGWEADCGVGDSVLFEFFCDKNENHSIDPDDRLVYTFHMIDGNITGPEPPDSNPTPDGIIKFLGMPIGLPPGPKCTRATDESASSAEDFMEVTSLPSPSATVSGTIFIEEISAPDSLLYYILITAFGEDALWSGLTDSSGDYTINLGSSGDGWHIGCETEIPGYETPPETTLAVTGNITGIDFVYKKSGIEEVSKNDDRFKLLTLTPNPALGNVMIQYMLPGEGEVSLKLYDLTGTVVETLVDEKKKSGYHNASLATKRLSSGVYFVRFEAGNHKETKKLLIVR